jgi:hypothetical protein
MIAIMTSIFHEARGMVVGQFKVLISLREMNCRSASLSRSLSRSERSTFFRKLTHFPWSSVIRSYRRTPYVRRRTGAERTGVGY